MASHHIVVVGDWMLDALRTISARAATKASVICPPPLMFVHSDQATARRRGRARLGVSSDETLVAFFGRLYPGKGIEEFLDAGPELLARNSSLRLGLIGGYYQLGVTWAARPTFEAELSTRIEGLGLQKSIVQSGEYPFEGGEASDLLSAIDIAVLPLPPGVRTNNSSFAALCAHGLPVVGVAARPPEPAILSGENALLIAKAEPGLIASAVLELLEDSRLRGRIASGAKVLARERFNWKTATIRMLELLEFDFRTIEQQESPKEPAAN